jgi:hypothetical protein
MRLPLQPAPRDRRRHWTFAEHAAVTVVVLLLAVALARIAGAL